MPNVTLVSVSAHGRSAQHACVPWVSGTGVTADMCQGPFLLISRGFAVRMLGFLVGCARGVFLDAVMMPCSHAQVVQRILQELQGYFRFQAAFFKLMQSFEGCLGRSGSELAAWPRHSLGCCARGGLHGFMWGFTCNPFRMYAEVSVSSSGKHLSCCLAEVSWGVVPGGLQGFMWGFA